MGYEAKLGDLASQLQAANISLQESEQRKTGSADYAAEIDGIKAKISAAEKAIAERAKQFDRDCKKIVDDAKAQREQLENEYKRQLKLRDEEAKAQNEQHKYKVQYLDVSQKDIKAERKRWAEKEKDYERQLLAVMSELRELRAEHSQTTDLHDAFKTHIEAKDSARSAKAANWEVKRKAMQAEHQLAVRHLTAEKNQRISQLEREIHKVKDELADAHEEIEKLSEEVGAARDEPVYEEKKSVPPPRVSSPSYASKPSGSASPAPVGSSVGAESKEESKEPAPAPTPAAEPQPEVAAAEVAPQADQPQATPQADEAVPPSEPPPAEESAAM
jgi:chromosome segregation ATPase